MQKDQVVVATFGHEDCTRVLRFRYLSFAHVTNGIDWPVEPLKREIINKAKCVVLTHSGCFEAASHAVSHGFFRLRKTQVPKAQNLGTIFTCLLLGLLGPPTKFTTLSFKNTALLVHIYNAKSNI